MLKDLYFLNSRELSERLNRNDISDDLAFKHFLIYSVLFSNAIALPIFVTCSEVETYSWWHHVFHFVIFSIIQVWGLKSLYKTNKKGDGKNFFLRWATLSLPIGVKVYIIGAILFAIVTGLLFLGFDEFDILLTGKLLRLFIEILGYIMQVYYFLLMQENLSICSSESQQAVSA
jgi:hypothetical protein